MAWRGISNRYHCFYPFRIEKTFKQSLTAKTGLAMLRDLNHNPYNKKFIMITNIRNSSPALPQQLLKIHAA